MSRIGKKPITIPKGVTVKVLDGAVEVQGPKGKLRQAYPAGINFELADGHLRRQARRDDPELGKFHGLARSLVANAVDRRHRRLQARARHRRRRLPRGAERQAGRSSRSAIRTRWCSTSRRDRHRHRQADAYHGDGRGSAAGGTGGRQHPPAAQAGSVQAEGRPIHRRSAEEEGRQDRSQVAFSYRLSAFSDAESSADS